MIDVITEVNDFINNIVWGVPIIVLLFAVGIYFTVRLGFIQFTKIKFIFKNTIGSMFKKASGKGVISRGQAALVSLGAIVGSGNIAGVATAIASGGPGALFWMWVAAFLGMATKFAEITLGIYYRKFKKNKNGEDVVKGGPMYYLRDGLKSKFLAGFYAVMAVFSYIIIAAVVDTNNIVTTINAKFNVPEIVIALVLVIIVGIVIFGGIKRLGKFSNYVVPFMGILYVICGLVIILTNASLVVDAFVLIFKSAFKPAAAAGGFLGASVAQVIKFGLARGMYSNEAGLGTAAITQNASTVDNPIEQAVWGVTEVFFDTIIINTITGLMIIMAGVYTTGTSGTALVMESADILFGGGFGSYFILAASILFSFTCLTSSSYVCQEAAEYLFGTKSDCVIRIVWLVFIFIGSYTTLDLAWSLADTANGLMAIPNLIGILLLSNQVVKIKKDYFKENNKEGVFSKLKNRFKKCEEN
ncbi:MAG: sodium:alanine symporter family protein [bacterium]|nr:sodium:alanine symporter family protein [bacterium]